MTLPDLFSRDPEAAVVQLLKDEGVPLNALKIKKILTGLGIPKSAADVGWPKVQKKIVKRHDVISKAGTYQWTDTPVQVPPALSPLDALDLIAKGGLREPKKSALIAIVRESLQLRAPAEDPLAAARKRQADIDAIRLLAELAIEVEQLTANEAEAEVVVHRVRARVHRSELEPIGRAGEETTFNRNRHKPIGGSIDDGASVVVVRPGYTWKGPYGDLLIEKAVVDE